LGTSAVVAPMSLNIGGTPAGPKRVCSVIFLFSHF
jgi:hypothetical protein